MREQTYIFKGKSHSDYSQGYMAALGLDADQCRALLAQRDFEQAQQLAADTAAALATRAAAISQASLQITALEDMAAAVLPADAASIDDWRGYRLELIGLPSQPGWPNAASWPTAPTTVV